MIHVYSEAHSNVPITVEIGNNKEKYSHKHLLNFTITSLYKLLLYFE